MLDCLNFIFVSIYSNQFKNFEKQCSFLGEVMAPTKEIWLSPEMKE